MDDHNRMTDTMELDSILAEANARRNSAASQPEQKPQKSSVAPEEEPAVSAAAPEEAPQEAEFEEDGFVFAAADGGRSARRKRRNRTDRKKKSSPIALIVVIALLVAGIAGFVLWKFVFSSPNVADNVVVNGIRVGGMRLDEAMSALAPVEREIADGIRVEVTCGEKKIILTKDDFVCRFNTEEVLRKAQEGSDGRSADYTIRPVIDDDGFAAAIQKVAAAVEQKAQDATVAAFTPDKKEMFTFNEGVSGLKLKSDELIDRIRKLFDSGLIAGTVEAPCDEEKPAVTAEDLKKNIKMLSSFTTVSTNTWNGTENMRVSLGACNGSVIDPGKTWSFNACTGDSNLESNGYKPAGVIIQGRHEIGIGGGICQSSTTIYNAGLLSGMEVVERYCHYYPSSYVDYGRDATIDYGNLDLKLKNPFSYQLFLKCYLDGDVLHAEIYGLPAKDFDEIRISTSDPSYTSTSYTVKAVRTFYKDGEKVRSEQLPSSTYYFSAPSGSSSATPTTAPTTVPTTPGADPTAPQEPSAEPGDDPTAPQDPGTDPADDPGDDPGTDPADDPGTDPADDPGDDPGTDPADNGSPEP